MTKMTSSEKKIILTPTTSSVTKVISMNISLCTVSYLFELIFHSGGYWLPSQEKCSRKFLIEIFEDKKDIMRADQISNCNFKETWPEFAIKNVWPQVKSD